MGKHLMELDESRLKKLETGNDEPTRPVFQFIQYRAIQEPRGKYKIKNPCPYCNPTKERGGRLFPDWDPASNKWYMKCYACSRLLLNDNKKPVTVQEYEARLLLSTQTKNGMARAEKNGKQIGRPCSEKR